MKILILASWYKNDTNIIRGSFFREQAIALKRAGHDVIVATVEQHLTTYNNIKKCGFKEYQDEGIRTIVYNQLSMGSGSTGISFGKVRIRFDYFLKRNLDGYRKIYKKLLAEGVKVDIVHAHSFRPAGYAACMLKELLGAPVVITEHNSSIMSGGLTPERKKGLQVCLNRAEGFYCVSRALAKAVCAESGIEDGNKIGIIPNILSPLFYYDPNVNKFDKYTLISIGQLIPSKAMDLLIDCFQEAFQADDGVRLIIAGDGVMRTELQAKIEDMHLGDRVSLLGRVDRSELAELMRKSHAFVLMSRLETFGVVYIEAMACGLPTIGTYNGGSDDILDQFESIGLQVDDRKGLITSMKALRNNEIHINEKALSKSIQNSFGEEKIVSLLEIAYEKAMKR